MSLDSYKEIRGKITALREQAKSAAKQAFDEGVASIFAAHPKLDSFSWKQYTPYFNDGDECVFSVQKDEIDLKFGGAEHDYYYLAGAAERENDAELKAAAKDLHEFLSAFDDQDYRDLFGDHVEVKSTRDGVTMAEYSHD